MLLRTIGAVAVLTALLSGDGVSSQLTLGQIGGVVVDQAGRAIPAASVSLRRSGEGVYANAATDADGRFAFDQVPTGTYSVDADFPVFAAARLNNIAVTRGATLSGLKLTLKLSTICECITYAAAPTDRPQKSAVIRGAVGDREGRPLLHASLEIKGGPSGGSRAWSGSGGQFVATLPVGAACQLVVSDAAFQGVTVPLTVREQNADVQIEMVARSGARLPDIEDFPRPCRCPSDLFQHEGR